MKKIAEFFKKKRTHFKAISMILVLALMIQTVSIAVTAISESGLLIDEMVSIDEKFPADNSLENMPSIVGEVESSRDQYTKVYELSDGSFYEVISNDPIHKNVDGQWEEPTNNMDIPESVDEVTSYCDELVDTISEEQNNGGASTFSYNVNDPIPRILYGSYVVDYDGNVVDNMFLSSDSFLLLNLDDDLLALSNTNQLTLMQTLHIECSQAQISNDEETLMFVHAVSEEWDINDSGQLMAVRNNQMTPIYGYDLLCNDNFLDFASIENSNVTCELDITEICHNWSKGTVGANGLYVYITGQAPSTTINTCYLTRRYIFIDAYDPDFTYHTIDMGNAGQVLINDLTNTITLQRNELYFPAGKMPINLYRYFDYSKKYLLLNPAGTGSHWNYECPLTTESELVTAWESFDGRTIRFTRTLSSQNEWYDNQGEGYVLDTEGANVLFNNYYGAKIYSPDGLTYTFGSKGKIIRIEDSNNNYIEVEYNGVKNHVPTSPQDYITSVKNNSGYRYNFTYDNVSYTSGDNVKVKNSLVEISYQKKIGDASEEYETICINDAPVVMSYEYVLLPDGNIALSKVKYPFNPETSESDRLIVEYLYDDKGRLVGIIDVDKRKLEIDYTKQNGNSLLDNYPSAFSFKELVFNESYTEDMPADQQYIDTPKSSLNIDRLNTYHRSFVNELEEEEELHYTSQFELLYYTNNEGKDYYVDYEWDNEKHYISQIVSPENKTTPITNPGFETKQGNNIRGWSGSGIKSVSGEMNGQGQRYAQIEGSIYSTRYAGQCVSIDGNAGDIFVIGCNARANTSVPSKAHFFGIEIYKAYKNGNVDVITDELLYSLAFDPTMDGEVQFRLGAFKLKEDVNRIYYKIVYSYQTGSADFDNVMIYESTENVDFFDAPSTENGNDNSVSINTPSTSSTSSNGSVKTDVLSDSSDKMISKYEYSPSTNYLMKYTDQNNISTNYVYDNDSGLLTKKSVKMGDYSSTLVDNYSYDAMGMLKEVNRVVNSLNGDTTTGASYTYQYGKISSVVHNNMTYNFNYNSYGDLKNIVMVPEENDDIQNITLISYEYTTEEDGGYFNTITYSNEKVLGYRYDKQKRIEKIYDCSLASSPTLLYSYRYDLNGNVSEIKDYVSERIVNYSDNSVEVHKLVINGTSESNGDLLYSKQIDSDGSENSNVFSVNYSNEPTVPTYNEESMTTEYSSTMSGFYSVPITINSSAVCDYFGRIKSSSVSYEYENSTDKHHIVNESVYKKYNTQLDNVATSATTNLLDTYTTNILNENADSTTLIGEFASSYVYDSAGRITHVYYKEKNSTSPELAYYYKYDVAGQLIKDADFIGDEYIVYSYDNYGNVTTKEIVSGEGSFEYRNDDIFVNNLNNYDVINFEYQDSYSDVLKKYTLNEGGSKYIETDLYGNPLNYYRNVDGTVEEFELTWSGYQLNSVKPKGEDKIYEYKYDDEGRRTQKITYSNITEDYPEERILETQVDYVWDNNKLVGYKVYHKSGSNPLTIEAIVLYDELGNPIGLRYNMDGLTTGEDVPYELAEEDIFWFIKDGQGNVKAIYSEKTNYTIGCNYINGQISIDFSDSFLNDLSDKLNVIEDGKEVLRVFFAYVITLQCAPLISIDVAQATYQSYIMDYETGLYYCQNRYYSPEYNRFINVDNFERITYDLQNPFNANPFVYYNNDPINCKGISFKSNSSSKVVGIQAELSKSLHAFTDSLGIEFIYDSVKDELYAFYYCDVTSPVDYTARAINRIKNILGNIPFSSTMSLKSLASNFKINNSTSLSYFSVENEKGFVWPNSYLGTAKTTPNRTNGYRGYISNGNGYQSKGYCYYPTSNLGFAFNNIAVKYTKLEVNFSGLKNFLSANESNIISATK